MILPWIDPEMVPIPGRPKKPRSIVRPKAHGAASPVSGHDGSWTAILGVLKGDSVRSKHDHPSLDLPTNDSSNSARPAAEPHVDNRQPFVGGVERHHGVCASPRRMSRLALARLAGIFTCAPV
jgi:hypothetical protein